MCAYYAIVYCKYMCINIGTQVDVCFGYTTQAQEGGGEGEGGGGGFAFYLDFVIL